MRDTHEPFFPPHAIPRQPGVAPFWRVLALLSLLAAAGLLVGVFVMAIALILERERNEYNSPLAQPPQVQANAPRDADDDPEDDDDPDPPNPPYPMQQDLVPLGRPKLPGEEPPPASTARQRYLQISREAWSCPEGHFPQHVVVSPDRRSLAYTWRQQLYVGTMGGGAPDLVGEMEPVPGVGPGAGAPGLGGLVAPGGAPGRRSSRLRVVGDPSWSADSRDVFFTDAKAHPQTYHVPRRQVMPLPFHGHLLATVPGGKEVVFRRSRPALKVEGPDGQMVPDPTEIVVGLYNIGGARVLVPENTAEWHHAAVSPDGKRVALVTEQAGPDRRRRQMRLLVQDLAGGASQPVGPPAPWIGPVSWTPDSQALVYCRRQATVPPDCWERGLRGPYRDTSDIFTLDLATRQETRLSRGGGFSSCCVTADGTLFFLIAAPPEARAGMGLRRVALAQARAFAAGEVEPPPRTLKDWTALAEQALKEAGLKPDASGADLTPEALSRLVDAYRAEYHKRFRQDPPATLAALEAQRDELASLSAFRRRKPAVALLLAVVEGDYLVRKHRAVWKLAAGPLSRPVPLAQDRSPFGLAVNPFDPESIDPGRPGGPEEEDDDGLPTVGLREWLFAAQGRPLVLTNDPEAAKAALAELADPALAQAEQLLKAKMDAEMADALLLDLAKLPKHKANHFLLLHVGRLLAEHQRWAALRRLMEPACQEDPPDARKYNLLGLAVLATDPQGAIKHFHNALRCNLRFAPGYLNLARAYEQAGNPQDAVLCLRRLLKMVPFDPHAADARQRLAALQEGNRWVDKAPGGAGAPR